MTKERHQAQKQRKNQARAARQAQRRKEAAVKGLVIVVVIAVALSGLSFLAFGINESDNSASTTTTTTANAALPPSEQPSEAPALDSAGLTPCPAADGSGPRVIDFKAGPANCIDTAKKYSATFDTSEGVVTVDLDTAKTPITTNNFVFLARYRYFDNTTIFRSDSSIDILQGGSPHTGDNADPGPGYTINDEGSDFKYAEGDLVMARTNEPNSASAQFFFAAGPKVNLLDEQGTYVTFGKTTAGLDVLKNILALNVDDPTSGTGAPSRTILIKKVTITEA